MRPVSRTCARVCALFCTRTNIKYTYTYIHIHTISKEWSITQDPWFDSSWQGGQDHVNGAVVTYLDSCDTYDYNYNDDDNARCQQECSTPYFETCSESNSVASDLITTNQNYSVIVSLNQAGVNIRGCESGFIAKIIVEVDYSCSGADGACDELIPPTEWTYSNSTLCSTDPYKFSSRQFWGPFLVAFFSLFCLPLCCLCCCLMACIGMCCTKKPDTDDSSDFSDAIGGKKKGGGVCGCF
mmetsp:Transcript_27059/g.47155  ORF Transcript_27059/g.47155 Transcript_27059/m.47155 type:complete len:240 (-) Transcript_27059:598-1317(-)